MRFAATGQALGAELDRLSDDTEVHPVPQAAVATLRHKAAMHRADPVGVGNYRESGHELYAERSVVQFQ